VHGPGGPLDTVNFDLGAATTNPYLVTDVANESSRLLVHNDSVQLSVFPSYSLASTGGASPSLVVGAASGDVAKLILSGANTSTFENDVTRIANAPGATGAVTVVELQWTGGNLRVGHAGEGDLVIDEAATVTSSNASLGHLPSSRGTVRVDGDATWTTSGDLLVGREGEGLLTILGSGIVVSNRASIGSEPTGSGSVSVTGVSPSWTIQNSLAIGTVGDGNLSISGGTITNADAMVGGLPASDGFVSVSGGEWITTGLLTVGGQDVGPTVGGSGLVRVSSGFLGAEDEIVVAPSGVLELQGGIIDADTITVEAPTGQFNFTGGILYVDQFNGDLENESGNFLPNTATVVDGNYSGANNSVLSYLITGPSATNQHGSVTITDTASLGGSLLFSVSSLYEPDPDEVYTLLAATDLVGAFTNVANGQRINTANLNGSFIVYYGPGSPIDPDQVVLASFLHAGPAGDYNNNGIVDAADYTVWRDNLGAPPGTLINDVDGGVIDQDQYDTWKANFGNSSGSSSQSNAAVPEPATWLLLTMAVIAAKGSLRF
jgi:T5SS/PEP-CTERM-associated repeat protein